MFAAGAITAMVNFHGHRIRPGLLRLDHRRLGRQAVEDVLKAVAFSAPNYAYIDPDKLGAAGTSYGLSHRLDRRPPTSSAVVCARRRFRPPVR
jgi:dipeptidyl aminopeptidase/acylaminoacyl peptidase